ncbi:MAG: iron-containing alcohol dehydrogenase [Gammaproteobacteria bacterium]|nr:iron-containing alcohol dehydrogenase [Gammaproteobacteria bacterium]
MTTQPLDPKGISAFAIGRLPRIEFGRGSFARLAPLVAHYGRRVLLVTGRHSFPSSPYFQQLLAAFDHHGLSHLHVTIDGEPSPQLIDALVMRHAESGIEVVVGIGGGSALDAAKALAGLLPLRQSVMDFLEGVGPELAYPGPALPLIAVPTTAGTGSEVTRNAVLSVFGPNGFKKSFRDEQLVAEVAIIDPALLASCPPAVIAANGMDALTQLLESYVSTRGNPLIDALALSGLQAVGGSLLDWYRDGEQATAAQQQMAYAAMLSGITLSQVGLGSVHGLAAPLGAFCPIPHGVACGTLVAAATRVNIEALKARLPDSPALPRYAQAARVLSGQSLVSAEQARTVLIELLADWRQQLQLPGLSDYGVRREHLDHIVAHARGNSMKTNPVHLLDDELRVILEQCL